MGKFKQTGVVAQGIRGPGGVIAGDAPEGDILVAGKVPAEGLEQRAVPAAGYNGLPVPAVGVDQHVAEANRFGGIKRTAPNKQHPRLNADRP